MFEAISDVYDLRFLADRVNISLAEGSHGVVHVTGDGSDFWLLRGYELGCFLGCWLVERMCWKLGPAKGTEARVADVEE
jgi:hypothetical protein